MLQKSRHRAIRKLRRLGYLEAEIDVPLATGYDPLLANEPQLARSMAASVRQRTSVISWSACCATRQEVLCPLDYIVPHFRS